MEIQSCSTKLIFLITFLVKLFFDQVPNKGSAFVKVIYPGLALIQQPDWGTFIVHQTQIKKETSALSLQRSKTILDRFWTCPNCFETWFNSQQFFYDLFQNNLDLYKAFIRANSFSQISCMDLTHKTKGQKISLRIVLN